MVEAKNLELELDLESVAAGTNLRGDRGQYFTPRGAIKLMVAMLDPKPTERVFDPACGTGGFLIATVSHLLEQFRSAKG